MQKHLPLIALSGLALIGLVAALLSMSDDPVSECVEPLIKHGTQEAFEQKDNLVIANYTNGGVIDRYETAADCMIAKGEALALHGQAISAGTIMADMMHKAGKFCMAEDAAFFYHEGTFTVAGETHPYPVDHLYSAEIQALVTEWPSTKSREYTKLTASDLAGVYPVCAA